MSKRIVIVGAGGFGRGVHSWLMQSPKHREKAAIQEIVFVDDDIPKVKPQAPVICTVRDYAPLYEDRVLVAVANPKIRQNIVESLELRGVRFHTFIADQAIVAEGSQLGIGIGTIVCPAAVIDAHVNIGCHVHVNFNSAVGHDTVLGDFTTLSPMTNVMGEVNVGSGVFVGGSAVVLPRIDIADMVTIGAGATVIRSVLQDDTVVGNPATKLETSRTT